MNYLQNLEGKTTYRQAAASGGWMCEEFESTPSMLGGFKWRFNHYEKGHCHEVGFTINKTYSMASEIVNGSFVKTYQKPRMVLLMI